MSIWFGILNSAFALLLGILVGLAELLSRYSDPRKVLNKSSAWYYISMNGIISILGYWALKKIQGNFVVSELEINNFLVAGLGAMVILRSSIANITHNGKKIELGLGGILQVFLDAIETQFNRKRSVETLNNVREIMKEVDFNSAKINLPSICLVSFQHFSDEKAKVLGKRIKTLSDKGVNHMRSVELGIILEEYFGEEFLKAAVEILKKQELEKKEIKESLNNLISKFKVN